MVVRDSVYESAVKGRRDMRSALRIARQEQAKLLNLLSRADEAINPKDRSGISLDKWQQRLKAITAEIRSVTQEN